MKKLNFVFALLILLSCNIESKKKHNELEVHHKSKNIEMNEQTITKLSKETLDMLSANDIVYAELAEGGAMGNAGGITIYSLKDNELNRFETSLFDNENFYSDAQKLLLEHQDKLEIENIKVDEILFDYHYGGMGNHVFINKRIALEKGEDFFTFKLENENYKIYPTVQGVFNSVTYSIDNNRKNN